MLVSVHRAEFHTESIQMKLFLLEYLTDRRKTKADSQLSIGFFMPLYSELHISRLVQNVLEKAVWFLRGNFIHVLVLFTIENNLIQRYYS